MVFYVIFVPNVTSYVLTMRIKDLVKLSMNTDSETADALYLKTDRISDPIGYKNVFVAKNSVDSARCLDKLSSLIIIIEQR